MGDVQDARAGLSWRDAGDVSLPLLVTAERAGMAAAWGAVGA